MDDMGSRFIVNPEEGLLAMEDADSVENKLTSPLYKFYQEKQNEFFSQFWVEHILPKMNEEAFLLFIDRMGTTDLGEDFVSTLTEHLEKSK